VSEVQRSRRGRRVVMTASAGAIVLVLLGVLLGVRSFQSEKRQPNVVYGARFCKTLEQRGGCVQAPDASMIYAEVLSVEPDQHQMTVRLTVLLPAGYFDEAGLTEAIALNVAGKDVATFEARSDQIHSIEVPVGFGKLPHECCDDVLDPNTSNQVTSYPFDSYDAEWSVTLRTVPPTARASQIPVRVSLEHAVHGYRISAREDLPGQYALHVERSGSTVIFAVFVMVMMWGLTLGIVAMAIILTYARRDIGPGVLGFLAAMLFAFPGIRSVLPGAPPLGSLNDFLAFFWCEGIIGITLLVLTAMYLVREHRTYRSERGPQPATLRR
jgi:hypothetical protein